MSLFAPARVCRTFSLAIPRTADRPRLHRDLRRLVGFCSLEFRFTASLASLPPLAAAAVPSLEGELWPTVAAGQNGGGGGGNEFTGLFSLFATLIKPTLALTNLRGHKSLSLTRIHWRASFALSDKRNFIHFSPPPRTVVSCGSHPRGRGLPRQSVVSVQTEQVALPAAADTVERLAQSCSDSEYGRGAGAGRALAHSPPPAPVHRRRLQSRVQ